MYRRCIMDFDQLMDLFGPQPVRVATFIDGGFQLPEWDPSPLLKNEGSQGLLTTQ